MGKARIFALTYSALKLTLIYSRKYNLVFRDRGYQAQQSWGSAEPGKEVPRGRKDFFGRE